MGSRDSEDEKMDSIKTKDSPSEMHSQLVVFVPAMSLLRGHYVEDGGAKGNGASLRGSGSRRK